MDKTYPSKQFVRCPKRGCDKDVRKDRLNGHLLSIHKESSYQIEGQSSLISMFGKQTSTSKAFPVPVEVEHAPIPVSNTVEAGPDPQVEIGRKAKTVFSELRVLKNVQVKALPILAQLAPVPAPLSQQEQISPNQTIQYGIPTTNQLKTFFAGHVKDKTPSQGICNDVVEIIEETIPVYQQKAPVTAEATSSSSMAIDDSASLETGSTREGSLSSSSDLRKTNKIRSFFSKFSFKKRKRGGSTPGSSLTLNDDNVVEAQLASISSNVVQIHETVNGLVKSIKGLDLIKHNTESGDALFDSKSTFDDTNLLKAKLLLVRASKSIIELQRLIPEVLFLEAENQVECQVCSESVNVRHIGSLSYDFALGSDFSNSSAPREFHNLKKKLITHLESNHHVKCATEGELKLEQNKKLVSRNYKVGMVLGMQAYHILKLGGSYAGYEDDVALLATHGLDVGNINHSRMFCSDFAVSVYDVLQAKLKSLITEPLAATGRPVSFSIACDKMTPNRQTMQIIAIHGYIGSKFQTLVAGVPALTGNDGLSVTKCIRKGLEFLSLSQDELASSMVGGAFDGEYFNLNVPKHFSNALLLSDEQKEWFSYQWDPAHILELAEKDSRKNCPSVKKTFSAINNVSKSFTWGKSFRELLEEAAKNDEKARKPGHFCDTRFATYTSVVLKNFCSNYKYYYSLLNRDLEDDLDKVNNAHFVFSLGALIDTYDVIAKLSNAMQKPGMPHWVMKTVCNNYLTKLGEMKELLESGTVGRDDFNESSLFPNLSKAVSEVKDKGEFQGCAILTKQHSVHRTRNQDEHAEYFNEELSDAIISASKSVATLIGKFQTNFSTRLEKENDRNPVFKYIDELFDVKEIVSRVDGNNIWETSLEKYVTLAKSVGSLNSEVSLESLTSQYKDMTLRIKEIADKFKIGGLDSRSLEFNDLKLYEKMLGTEALYKGLPDILHLALTGLSRTHCEAVVEGMGSVLGNHLKNRSSLKPKTVEIETVIRWQGPHPSDLAKPLVELSLDNKFKGRNKWHFCVSWDKSKHFARSEVLNRIAHEAQSENKISF